MANIESPIIEAVILVGGKGVRLRSLVHDRPKPMAEVGGRPFVEWLLLTLAKQGIARVVLCTGFMAEFIESHFSDKYWQGMEVVCIREPCPLGTGGALRNALGAIKTDVCLVLNGDSYCSFDLNQIRTSFLRNNADILLLLTYQADVSRYGTVRVDESGSITDFLEKTSTCTDGYISAGVYMMRRSVIAQIPRNIEFSLERDLFPSKVRKGLFAMVGTGPFVDIGTPDSYAEALSILRSELDVLGCTADEE